MELYTEKKFVNFETKECAQQAKKVLEEKFPRSSFRVIKALPEFRGNVNKYFSLYYKAGTFAEDSYISIELKKLPTLLKIRGY